MPEDEPEISFFDYRGLEIGVQSWGEFSRYVVFDGEGQLMTGDLAGDGQTASDNAKEWVVNITLWKTRTNNAPREISAASDF